MIPLDLNLSASTSSAAEGRTGDFSLSGGANRSNAILFLALAAVAVVGLILFLRR